MALMISSTLYRQDGHGELFGDQEPRFFIYWTSDRYQKTGCFNTLCPGFISVNPRAALGTRFTRTSTPGGDQFFVRFLVAQQKQDWWLYVNYKVVGFWPGRLFNHMKEKAEKVMWGGEVYSEHGIDFPPMGSGYHSKQGWEKACFIKNIGVVKDRNERSDAPLDTITFVDSKCYSVTDEGIDGDPSWRRYFYFGGPGGQC
ncbi:protein neprosin-like [Aristolochia californica]|uniref:protein neprosin-like n=1 Tax=Aristolochia californica TaxID=171875 RepID=UPI0035D6BD75